MKRDGDIKYSAMLRPEAPVSEAVVMAEALRTVVQANTDRPGLCVMAGHDEGVIAYGPTVAPVLSLLTQPRWA